VFVQYLKTRPNDQQMNSSLQFLLQAMQALRRKNPLTESFLVQLDLDLEGAGIAKPYMPVQTKNSVIPVNTDPVGCTSIFEIRETQNQNAPINRYANSRTSSQNAVPPFLGDDHRPPVFGSSNVNSVGLDLQTESFIAVRNPQRDLQNDFSAHRGAVPGAATFLFTDSDTNDIDMSNDQPSPSTINSQSRGGSTSQSSYSPGQQNEHHLPYRASPRVMSQQVPQIPSGQSTSSVLPLYSANHDLSMNSYPSDAINNGNFDNSYEWEFSAMNTGTGMTPMSEGSWNQMLDSVTMGWDVLGTSHGANVDAPGADAGAV
jgi:hypothetical protein